ncbi:O-antigen ligase family protein [Azospirillum picis]|uniref:O-antigen ligase n=1 Tax=Azospirillum picis TaxID=488438 RepID=A0ABU0MCV0_9PROT|nr:O-antigen ligase family protein [Azospirillum picis]MBP2297729.1 O-antigen ligase [Azospirillum picis]MDQ0531248.1 O-antigen ligase [Azospirillum picis]
MAVTAPRPARSVPDATASPVAAWLDGGHRILSGVAALLLGPLAALAPRGLPLWVVAVLLLALAGLARQGRLGTLLRPGPALPAGAAFVLLALASCLWSPSDRSLATVGEIGYVALAALAGSAWLAGLPAAEARRTAALFLAGGLAGGLLFAYEAARDFPLNRWWNAVPDEQLPNLLDGNVPKRTAALLCLLVWPAALTVHRFGRRGLALLVPVAYGLACLPLTSRSAMLGIAVGLATLAAARTSLRWTRRVIGTAITAAFLLVLPTALLLAGRLDLDHAHWLFRSAQHRVEIWGHAATRALEAPLLGQGIDSSRSLAPQGAVSEFVPLGDSLLPLHPHNAFLQVWLETGAVGAALALALMLMLLAATARLERRDQPFALALYATSLAMGSTAYGIWQVWWMGGFLAAALMLRLATRIGGDRA